MRGLLFKLIGLGVLVGSLTAGWIGMDYNQFLARPLALGGSPRLYLIEPGTSLREIAADLDARGYLERPAYLLWYARWYGKAREIKAGEYEIQPGTTPVGLLALFVRGEVVQRAFTVIEGWTFAQLRAALAADGRFVQTLEQVSPPEIMARLGAPGVHPEGWFLPDTYYFTRGTRDIDLLARAKRAMQVFLDREWARRAAGLPYEDPYEALILASIVEKETGQPQERARIAGVFLRRLERGMRLEADPTVIYGLGPGFAGTLTRRLLRREGPYNTYTSNGLTPTPIALPGRDAIRAALHPEPGEVLFFVSKGDGTHAFSATYEEHRKAVRMYRPRRSKRKGGSNG